DEEAAALGRVKEANKAAEDASAKFGIEQKAAAAYVTAYSAAINSGKDAEVAKAIATEASRHATAEANIELSKAGTIAEMAATGVLKIAEAYQQSDVAGIQAAASVKARSDELQTGISYEQAYTRALTEGATTAIQASAQRYAAGQQTLAANEAIAAAA